MSSSQPTPKQKRIIGILAIVVGLFFALMGLGLSPIELQESEAPGWVVSISGLIFFLAGVMVLIGEKAKNINLYASILIGLMGTVGAWIALFGDDENISGGFSFVSAETNYMFARILFGLGAIICYAISAHAFRVHLRNRTND